jgi:DNA-directed RNA polymerase subunit M/transcription elongation factor TFIIS
MHSARIERKTETTVMIAADYKKRSSVAAHMSVPTCTKCEATEFIHQDQEFGGEMTRIIFCSTCGTVIGVVVAI